MTEIAWLAVIGVSVVCTAWRVFAGLRRLAQARAVEATWRDAYRRCVREEREREAAELAARTLAADEAEMARLVEWYRKTEGTGEARSEGS
jgi:hypothetical protein